jgi:hypothetical protein
MGADFSCVRLNPLLDYAGVELKQGGVLLDADANELVAIIDRRVRALASDTLGRARVSSTTPDAFKITAAGGTLQIGRGRLYVDGLLAECHGAADPAKRQFDDLLAETGFGEGVDFKKQPYVPVSQALPTTGQHLVYLDVWDREVTNLTQPDLVETAVGVETSSRVQTVWQVKLLSEGVDGATTCGTDLTEWDSLVAPSTGRLTTSTYEVPPANDPCELPPTGGYRGLENQLYRVEIHTGGKPGAGATFKWSRENASVGSRVADMVSATELELESLGRDDVLRFKTGDWVEIINDAREFSQLPGEIRKITVTDATKRISFVGALPGDMLPQPANFPNSSFPDDSNLRVTRWDQSKQIFKTNSSGPPTQVQDLDAGGSTGLIDVPASGVELLLENGITVSFSSAGPKGLKPGDYWVFAARTADASVEILDEAPPRGTHHHFARLGIWDAGSGAVTDCRSSWPPATGDCDCACTLCVTPKSHADGSLTIQAAVDKLRDTGGTICLQLGSYPLQQPVQISGTRGIRITGQGSATVVGAGGTAFLIDKSDGISIESLTIQSLFLRSAISVRSASGLTLRHLSVLPFLADQNPDAQGAAIALSGVVRGANIHDNLLTAPDGVRALEPEDGKVPAFLVAAGLAIDSNVFFCRDAAIKFDGPVGHWFDTRVIGNQIIGTRDIGISFTGFAFPGSSMRIIENNLQPLGPGIRCSTGNLWIEDNKVQGPSDQDRKLNGPGISLTGGFFKNVGIDQARVLANEIALFPEAGISVDVAVSDLIIQLNIIENCRDGIVVGGSADAESLSINNNQLRDIGQPTGLQADGNTIVGIGLIRTEEATIAGNILRRIGSKANGSTRTIVGISAQSVARVRIIGNEVTEVGPEEFGGEIAGIAVNAPYQQAEVSDNCVDRDVELSRPPSSTAWYALNIRQPMPGRNFLSNFGRFISIALDESRTLSVNGGNAWVTTAAGGVDPTTGRSVAPPGATALVRGNSFTARGGVQAIDISATGDVLFSDNRCELRRNFNIDAVQIATPVAVVNANRVRGGEGSIQLSLGNTLVTAIGNITTGPIGPNVPAQMTALNLIG